MRTAENTYAPLALELKKGDKIAGEPPSMFAGAIWGDFQAAGREIANEPVELKDGTVAVPVVALYVDNDRLVAECPFCSSAQLASETDHRFFCHDCGNATVGGAFVKTTVAT